MLLPAAVAHGEELCQELIEQCREEEMDVSPGLKLASREQFEELALMADFSFSNLPLAGELEALGIDLLLESWRADAHR